MPHKHKLKIVSAGSNIPDPSKQPRAEQVPDWMKYNPAWRISILETRDPYGWHVLDKEKLNEVRQKLAQFEGRNWNDILVRDRDHNHAVALWKLSSDARKRLEEIRQDDVEELISLRLSGKERAWGIRDGYVLKLLWWDPDHQVCPSLKKHT